MAGCREKPSELSPHPRTTGLGARVQQGGQEVRKQGVADPPAAWGGSSIATVSSPACHYAVRWNRRAVLLLSLSPLVKFNQYFNSGQQARRGSQGRSHFETQTVAAVG